MDLEAVGELAGRIARAGALVIGASNGFSIAEGIRLFDTRGTIGSLYGDLDLQARGIFSLLDGMVYPWESAGRLWGFWIRMIRRYCLGWKSTALMEDLRAIAKGRRVFIITTNGEGHFELGGFGRGGIWEREGGWTRLACAARCSRDLIDDHEALEAMSEGEAHGIVPGSLIPRCPRCGAPLVPSMAAGIADDGQAEAFKRFIKGPGMESAVFLDLGTGPRNALVKEPLRAMAMSRPGAAYAEVNLRTAPVPGGFKCAFLRIDGDMGAALKALRSACGA